MLILPAIDLRNGKCVNLVQGRAEEETVFSDQPIEMAKRWEAEGAEYLHLVDLDGAFHGASANLQIVREIVETIRVPVQLGGGIRTLEQLDQVLAVGVARAILGTAALKDPDLVKTACREYGAKIAVGIDAKDELVATEGWLDVSHKPAIEFAKEMRNLGVSTIIYTDIKSDGMLKGPNMEATRAIVEAVDINVIASGGITSVEDLKILKSLGASGAIIGRALYTGDLELRSALAAVRPH
ncbi:MAG: 1-(5-phosphoribosyl)-5-[(5-phosphoribosylamino)methylideneamino]imidazole-4-carboxamide isomerase [Candidatus Poribacteria bacterium]|nr:1-(5-phosphoribosyl)-5-[(5-phosphoribosylamino)methylideneamino]imidazole-4-carboxamide isomerase [Candidatus Poribacteria bacterium]MDE0504800.1 1-(5-phosphoribosyl)-5-[(5-phosphoribosylamino)methylideneamino]imidazole-4-carboxamide isomerase [Candidatus Poribacteria bacterium]